MNGSPRRLSICVFCGARSGRTRGATEAARELGRLLGERGHRLIYGGGGSGLMGEVAWAAYQSGSHVTGIIPDFLYEREKTRAAPPQRLHITATMGERKREMLARADAFVALPGGYGTLDEVLEVLSLTYLRIQDKPMVLLDVEGAWRRLMGVLDDFQLRGFADPRTDELCRLAAGPGEALDCLERSAATRPLVAASASAVPAIKELS